MPDTLWNEIKRLKRNGDIDTPMQEYERIVDFYMTQLEKNNKKWKRSDLLTFCQALLCQPSLGYGKIDNPDAYKYIFDKPSSLPVYFKNFLPPNEALNITLNESNVLSCKGINRVS